MKTFSVYLVESTLCMAVLFLFYHFFLRGLTFYRVRRFFLLMIIFVSLLIPAIEIKMNSALPVGGTDLVIKNAIGSDVEIPQGKRMEHVVESSDEPAMAMNRFNYETLILVLYLTGCSLLCFRFLKSLYDVFKIKSESEIGLLNGRRIYFHSKAEPAFSFAHFIFLHPSMVEHHDMEIIFRHEESHVNEGHTCDILFVEFIRIIFWANPMLYLISRELSIVHEFYADDETSKDISRKTYATLLLSYVQKQCKMKFTHPFFQLPIRQRVQQLFRGSSSPRALGRIIFVMPVLTGLFFAFSCASEFEVHTSLPNGKKVKSIKVIYHDDFGDMPEYDGSTYSSVEFDRRGKIQDLKKGTYHENIHDEDLTMLPHFDYSLDNIIWYLDYGFYTSNERYIAFGVNNWLENHLDRIEQFYENVEVTRNEYGQPIRLFFVNKRERYEDWQEWTLTYDSNRKLQSIAELSRMYTPERGWNNHTASRNFEHNAAGKLTSVKEGESGINISYNAEGSIEQIVITTGNVMVRRFEYTYDQPGIRSTCTAFNQENQKEFTLDYLYTFF